MPGNLAGDEVGGIGGDGETDALRAGDDGGVDADDFARRGHQRAAGIAGVERRVGLHHVLDHAGRVRDCSVRPSAETTPVVTVASKPSGLPIAMAICPRFSFDELPSFAAGRATLELMRNNARSVSGSSPSTLAERRRPSSVSDLDAFSALNDVRVGQRQAVGRDDDAGARAAPGAVAHVDAHDARTDAIDDLGDDARIGVEGVVVDGPPRRPGTQGFALGVEDVEDFERGMFRHAMDMVYAGAGAGPRL